MFKYFKYIFAQDGEKDVVPDVIDVNGYVSVQEGYGGNYELVDTDPLSKAPERKKLNYLLNIIMGEIKFLQIHGFPDYITSALNGGTAYAYDLNAIVRWTDGINYINTVAGNTNAPDVSGWVPFDSYTPVGMICGFGAPITPTGWLHCDGSLVSRVTYARLFAYIGTYWGEGDGVNTFQLPDGRGQFRRGFDDGRGVDTGRVFGSTQSDLFKAHQHSLHSVSGYMNIGDVGNARGFSGTGVGVNNGLTDVTGGSETRPTNIPEWVCIKF